MLGAVARLLACGLALLLIVPLSGQQRPQVLSRLTWFDRAGTRLGGIRPVADHGISSFRLTALASPWP